MEPCNDNNAQLGKMQRVLAKWCATERQCQLCGEYDKSEHACKTEEADETV